MILILALINIIKNIVKSSSSKQAKKKNNLVNSKKEKTSPKDDSNPKEAIPEKFEKLIKAIEQNLDLQQLYSPENNNSLHYLKILSLSDPKNKALKKLTKLTSKKIVKKIKRHKKNKEYEGIFVTASESLKINPTLKLNKWLKMSEKQLLKNNDSDLKFVHIEGGLFEMGDFLNSGFKNAPIHKVTLSDFHISETNVTNEQFCKFLNSKGNHKTFNVEWINLLSPHCMIELKNGNFVPKHPFNAFPVIEVSWYGAQEYCKWIDGYLPTEAEWEFVARNRGENILYPTGETITLKDANFLDDNSDNKWHSVIPVKTHKPTKLGIYEICGNVMEWCADVYDKDYYLSSPKINPII